MATSGPTDSSASVIVVMSGSAGSDEGSSIRSSRMSVLVSRIPGATSESGVEDCVEVAPQCLGVDARQARPTATEFLERHRWTADGHELGNRLAGAGDRQSLTPLDAIDHFTAVIA